MTQPRRNQHGYRLICGTLVVALSAGMAYWHHRMNLRSETLLAELQQREGHLASTNRDLEDARRVRNRFEKFSATASEVLATCNWPGGSSALATAIVDAQPPNIELQEVRASRAADELTTWSVQLVGWVSGDKPRVTADLFLRKAEAEWKRTLKADVAIQFDKMEALAGDELKPEGERKVFFRIVATVKLPQRSEAHES